MKNYIYYLSLVMISWLFSGSVFASPCSVVGGGVVTYNYNYSIPSAQNYAGFTLGWRSLSAPGSFYVGGACDKQKSVFWSAQAAPGLISAGNGWFSIPGNDYLQVAGKISVYSAASDSSSFYQVPFTDISNGCTSRPIMCGGAAATGSRAQINFRIMRPFVGESFINQDVFVLSGNNGRSESHRQPMVLIHMNIGITVPQSCALNTADIITMDFKEIGSTLFSQAGAGNKPMGVKPKTEVIGIKCKNIDAEAMLTIRLEANNISGNAMVSSNRDVGFIVADVNQNPLTPNNINSNIPFRLDENAAATVPITAWPVSITGRKPAAGRFTAEGYLRIDFD